MTDDRDHAAQALMLALCALCHELESRGEKGLSSAVAARLHQFHSPDTGLMGMVAGLANSLDANIYNRPDRPSLTIITGGAAATKATKES
jgi:hypothetical protein